MEDQPTMTNERDGNTMYSMPEEMDWGQMMAELKELKRLNDDRLSAQDD